MHARLHIQSRRFAGWLARWTMLASITTIALQGCESRSATGVQPNGAVRLALATSVIAAPGAVVEASVSYTPPNGAPITLAREEVTTNTGGADASLSLNVDVAACVRAAPTGGSCVLDLSVILKRDGVILDQSAQRLTVGPSTERIDAAPVQLSEVASIRIAPATVSNFEPADIITLSATALDRNGGTVAARSAIWSVVSGGVTINSTSGVMVAVTPGPAVVLATMGGKTQSLNLVVTQPSVASLSFAPLPSSVFVGNQISYRVTVLSRTGAELTNRPITVTSSNTAVATVAVVPGIPTYLVTTLQPGSVTFTARSTEGQGGAVITATTTVAVLPQPAPVVTPASLIFATALLTPLPPSQTVAVTNPVGGAVSTISVVTSDTMVVATLDRNFVPAVLTVRATTALAPGVSLQREVRIRSTNTGIPDGVVTVTVTGIAISQGVLSGVVNNVFNSIPIAGATITIRRAVDNVLVGTAISAASGIWTSIALPAATYTLLVTAPGYLSVNVSQVTVIGGPNIPITPVATISLVPIGGGSWTITGSVRDATTNGAIDAATVELRSGANNVTGTVIASGSTNVNAGYAFPPQQAGTYTVRVTKTGYVDAAVVVTVSNGTAVAPTVFMSPSTGTVAWRFVLQWGATPEDLDAHLTGPIPSSIARFHVFFSDEGSLVASPFARLDYDEIYGFGPETITMSQEFAGTYRYFVVQYSEAGTLRTSNAVVRVYKGNALVAQFSPPQQDGYVWSVLEISNGVLTPINAIGDVNPSIKVPDIGPRNSNDRAAAAMAEWYNLAPWNWNGTKRPRR